MITRLLTLTILCALTALGQVPKTVTADRTNATILWPTNFFAVNTNALVAALVDHFGTCGMPANTWTNTDSYAALAADALSRTNQVCLLWDDFERTVSGTSAMGPSIVGPDLTQYATNWLEHTDASLDGHDYVITEPWNRYMWSILGGQCDAAPNTIEARATWTALAGSGTSDYIMLGTSPGGITTYATNSIQARFSSGQYALYVYHPAESGGSRLLAGWSGYTISTNVVVTYQLIVNTNAPYAAIVVNGSVLASSTDARIADCGGSYTYVGNWHITWATPWMSAAVHSLSAWKPAITPVTLGGTGITNALAFTAVGDGLTNSVGTIKAALGAGTNVVLTTNAGLISIHSSASGGIAGTVVTNATGFTQYVIPMMSDASGTNIMPGPLVGDATMTNMHVIGQFAADRIVISNAAYFGGSALGLSNAITIQTGTLGDGAGGGTGGSLIYAGGNWSCSNSPAVYVHLSSTGGASTNRLIDLSLNAVSKFAVSADGAVAGELWGVNVSGYGYFPGLRVGSVSYLAWLTRCALYCDSTTDIQIGGDGASPSVFMVKCADGSGTNIVSSSLKLTPGQPTGTAYSGDLLMQTYQPRTTSDATKSTSAITRHEYVAEPETISDGVASSILTINLTTNKFVGGTIHYTIHATDSTDYQALSGMATWAAVNKAGTITCTISEATHAAAVTALSSGTLTDAWTIADDTNDIKIMVEADSSLTTPTITIHYSIIINGNDASVVSPPPAS